MAVLWSPCSKNSSIHTKNPPYPYGGFFSPSGQSHVEQRVGVPLFVLVCPLVGHKAQVLVETHRLGILLVDGDGAYAVPLDAVLEQPPPCPLPSL
jgi:hypothetical protein